MKVQSFPPVIDERARLLILGSMPGVASLRSHQYYGHPRNHFWPILYALFEGRAPDAEYGMRLRFVQSHRIALWDSIAACVREGSMDARIQDAAPNDIPGLLRRYPKITAVVCNGAKSYEELLKHHGASPEIAGRKVLKLPSTSPIPTPKFRSFEDRLQAWQVIKALVSPT